MIIEELLAKLNQVRNLVVDVKAIYIRSLDGHFHLVEHQVRVLGGVVRGSSEEIEGVELAEQVGVVCYHRARGRRRLHRQGHHHPAGVGDRVRLGLGGGDLSACEEQEELPGGFQEQGVILVIGNHLACVCYKTCHLQI